MENKQTGYPSIDKPWMKFYPETLPSVPKCTVWRNIYDNNKSNMNDFALQYFGRKISFGEMFSKIEEVKKAFIMAGVKRGDNVSFLMLSCPEMVYAFLALNQLGATANMVNPTFTAEQMRDRINDSAADIILILDQLYERILPVLGEICPKQRIIVPLEGSMPVMTKAIAHWKLHKQIRYSADTITWKAFVKIGAQCEVNIEDQYVENTPAVMVYSSGTTGASKGIVLVNDGINHTISEFDRKEHGFSRQLLFLHMGAPWLSTLLVICLLMPLKKGMTVILEPLFEEKAFLNDMLKYKPNATLTTISHWLYLINSPKAKQADISSMTFPLTGGEKVLSRNEEAINEFFHSHGSTAKLYCGYGMCELGSEAAGNNKICSKAGSAGYPIAEVTISAFDPVTNKEQKYGDRGEIRVLSPARMKEYYKRPDATAEYFWEDSQGRKWGCTGDIGYVDEDGFVFIQGRKTDTYLTKEGNTRYCFDIEDIVLQHSGVDQCEVVGVRNTAGYDKLCCFVVKNSHCTLSDTALKEDVLALFKQSQSSTSILNAFAVLEHFPIKPSGKRDMEKLKSLAVEIMEKQK